MQASTANVQLSVVVLIPPNNCKNANSVKNAFDNNRWFKTTDGLKLRPNAMHNVFVELLYDSGKCKLRFFKP